MKNGTQLDKNKRKHKIRFISKKKKKKTMIRVFVFKLSICTLLFKKITLISYCSNANCKLMSSFIPMSKYILEIRETKMTETINSIFPN